jgi:MFS transporter, ACS family, hexuronate transporter
MTIGFVQGTGPSLASNRRSHVRWVICGLLFFATTVNYMDRQVLGIVKPLLERDLHWSEADYGWMVSAFQLAYAMMMPVVGRLLDGIGVRAGYALGAILWSLASMSHALCRTSWQFIVARFGLGIGEAANFPAAIKAVAEWFPEKERALATGILNSGSNMGAMLAPLLVPFFAVRFGWRSAFVATGCFDLIWVAVWLGYFRKPADHPNVSPGELAYIEAGQAKESKAQIPYAGLLKHRQAWAFIAGKFMTDPVWWFYLFWVPGFLNRAYGLNLTQLGPPLVVIYLAADAGSIIGGWMAATFAKRGWNPNKARKVTMLICALAATPVSALFLVNTLWQAVALISIAAAAHQGWSANLFTIVSDLFPRKAVGSVVGLGGLAGSLGGMLAAPMIGYWLDLSGDSYRPIFFIGGTAYLCALAVIQLLIPKLRRLEA